MKYESQGVSISMSFCWINYHQTEQGDKEKVLRKEDNLVAGPKERGRLRRLIMILAYFLKGTQLV